MNLKFRNDRGETLIEVLASILISTLSVALLFTCVMASGKIGDSTQKLDEKHYNALSEADAQSVPPLLLTDLFGLSGSVEVTGENSTGPQTTTAPVNIYGGEGMFSYNEPVPTPTPEVGP